MAKSYAERNAESIARYGKSLYERRIEAGQKKGLSRSQSRGHAREARGEQPASVVQQIKRFLPPPITRRSVKLPSGTRVVQTKSTNQIYKYLNSPNSRGKRVYFQVFNPSTGQFVKLYFGREKRSSPHGITVQELLTRVKDRQGMGMSLDDAIRDTFSDDGSEGAGVDSPETEGIEYDFSMVTMYIK
jgi:hypothetical protein